jgi:fructan beta-fructosidase
VKLWMLAGLLCVAGASLAGADEDVLIADFEQGDYGAWVVEGTAFSAGPAQGTLPGQMPVAGFLGNGLVNSFNGGDTSEGVLTSPAFKIERNYINLLVGGGGYKKSTCVNLVVGDEVVRTATGSNIKPGGTEDLRWQEWDVREYAGREARIRIVDSRTGGWGHINVDHIIQSDEKVVSERRLELVAEKRYLNLPVKNGAPKLWLRLLRGEEILREFDIELAESTEQVDFWVTLELSEFAGQNLTLQSDAVSKSNAGFGMIAQADEIIGGENLYREAYRPAFHFTAKRGWNNDPNGLVYFDGEYHLFFQHNPYGTKWGNMTWGHAVSRDLVHWEELGDAIHPDALGTIFSGSAVVDWKNTTGFQTGDTPPLVCIYTYAGDQTPISKGKTYTQALAYSNDRGRTWTKYAGNPVQGQIEGGNRDPKVIWHEPSQQWVIALYLDKHKMAFFTSPNLKEWTQTSTLQSFHECPEIFTLRVGGDAAREKWVFYGAAGDYLVGEFDGKTFTPDGPALTFNHGDCFYASQTYSDIPAEDGRRIQIAWGQTAHPEMPFSQMMDFPVELTLEDYGEGPRLKAVPVREIAALHAGEQLWKQLDATAATKELQAAAGKAVDVELTLEPDAGTTMDVEVRGLKISYDAAKQELRCKEKTAPLPLDAGRVKLRLLVDTQSVEIFGHDGRVYMPMAHLAKLDEGHIAVSSTSATAQVAELKLRELKSIWK